MKVLITGASGLLGRAMMRAFADYEVMGLAHTRANPEKKLFACDLRDAAQVEKVVSEFKPFVIIHCAAERRPDVCNQKEEDAVALNVKVTEQLAKTAQVHDAWLLYISTDYIFDGTNPPYQPNSEPNPLSIYGRTKLEGEKVIFQNLLGAGIVRVPILYGPVEHLEESAVTVLLKNVLDDKTPVKIDSWQVRYPTHVDDVAAACRKLCDRKSKHCGFGGTWHFSGEEVFTKYSIAKLMGELFGLDTSHITENPEPGTGAPRPRDCHLDTTALQLMGIVKLRPFRDGLKDALQKGDWVKK